MAEDLTTKLPNTISDILSKWSKDKIIGMRNLLRSNNKISKGNLLDSLVVEIKKKTEINIKFVGYGQYVDKGRRPGSMPPISAIEDWCSIKGIPKEAAYPIAKSIERKGIPPTNFTDVIYESVAELSKLLALGISKDMAKGIANKIRESFEKK